MKILYSIGNLDCNQQSIRFLSNSKHQIMIAAHLKSSRYFSHIHWTLDALYNELDPKYSPDIFDLLGHKGSPKTAIKQTEILLREIDDFGPDLIISNGEPVVAHFAKALSIKLWYCSPIHLLDGIEWERKDLKYFSLLSSTKKFLSRLPEADKILVYSPFGDLINCPALKSGYEWIQPYWIPVENKSHTKNMVVIPAENNRLPMLKKILDCMVFDSALFTNLDNINSYKESLSNCNWFLSVGDTSYIADAVYNIIPNICITPSLDQPEHLLNAILCKMYGLGDDLTQVELIGKSALVEIEKSQMRQKKSCYIKQISSPKLDEKIDESGIKL